ATSFLPLSLIPPSSLYQCYVHHLDLRSFPTRCSSDLQCRDGRCDERAADLGVRQLRRPEDGRAETRGGVPGRQGHARRPDPRARSEEHTSELQSREKLVCRLLLEKKNHRPIVAGERQL